MAPEKAAQYAARTERLERRAGMLERIATNPGADPALKIDRSHDDGLTNDMIRSNIQ